MTIDELKKLKADRADCCCEDCPIIVTLCTQLLEILEENQRLIEDAAGEDL